MGAACFEAGAFATGAGVATSTRNVRIGYDGALGSYVYAVEARGFARTRFYLVDLPGYGYARGGATAAVSFDRLVGKYFALPAAGPTGAWLLVVLLHHHRVLAPAAHLHLLLRVLPCWLLIPGKV